MALELAVHLDPRRAEGQDVKLVDGQDRGGYGRFDDSGCVDRPVVSLLGGIGHVVGDVVVSHVVVVGIAELGGASSLSSCCDGHSLVD